MPEGVLEGAISETQGTGDSRITGDFNGRLQSVIRSGGIYPGKKKVKI